MKNCSLYLRQEDLNVIVKHITDSFPKSKIELKEQNLNLTQIKVTKKTGWFGEAAITMSIESAAHTPNFELTTKGMINLLSHFSNQNRRIKEELASRIKNTKTTIYFFADSGYELFEDNIFQIAKAFDGLLFVDGLYWVDSDRQVIVDLFDNSANVEPKIHTKIASSVSFDFFPIH